MRLRARTILSMITGAVAAVAISAAGVSSSASAATPSWAFESTATLHPGVMAYTAGAQCTANFVYTDGAATCTSATRRTAPAPARPPTPTGADTVAAARHTGHLQPRRERSSARARGRHRHPGLLVVAGDAEGRRDRRRTPAPTTTSRWSRSTRPTSRTSTPPSRSSAARTRWRHRHVGRRQDLQLRQLARCARGSRQLSPKLGVSLGDNAGGWTTLVYTVTPGIPGDSGSGFMDANGNAFGVLSTVAIAPVAGSNGVGDLRKELAYANTHGMTGVASSRARGRSPRPPDPVSSSRTPSAGPAEGVRPSHAVIRAAARRPGARSGSRSRGIRSARVPSASARPA